MQRSINSAIIINKIRIKKDRKRLLKELTRLGAADLFPLITGDGRALKSPELALNYQYIGLLPFGSKKNRAWRLGSYVLAFQMLPGVTTAKSSFPVALRLAGFPYSSKPRAMEEWLSGDGAMLRQELSLMNTDIANRIGDRFVRAINIRNMHLPDSNFTGCF